MHLRVNFDANENIIKKRQDVIAHDYQQPSLKSSTATAHKAAPNFSCYFSLG